MKIKKSISVFLSGALAATGILAGTMSLGITANAAGTWEEAEGGWKYQKESGEYALGEYIDGWWVDYNGIQSYSVQASWKHNSTGWWYEDTTGWYPVGTCYWIDGTLYFFDSAGYLIEEGWVDGAGGWWYQYSDGSYAASEWVDGYWLSADGYWTYTPRAQWYHDNVGWYYMDTAGYYEKDGTVKIDGVTYQFDEKGYLKEFTLLEAADSGSTTVTLSVPLADKDTAAKQMSNLLGAITQADSSTTLTIDGEKKKVSNKSGVIYIEDATLADYVNKVSSTSTDVKIDFDTPTNKVFDGIFLTGTNNYDFDVKVGDATFKNIKVDGDSISFEANGKAYKGGNRAGALAVEGDVNGEKWVEALKSAGAIKNNILVAY
ncbi:MAG: hypothetical protein K6E10_09835 [Eubacterium sp.]|nr:hypothetical protein [Eubacterium sp.]